MICGCPANEEEQELIDRVDKIYCNLAADERNGRCDRTEELNEQLEWAQERYQELQTSQKEACNLLLEAAASGNYPEVTRLLKEDCLAVGVTVDGADGMAGGTALIRAACNGNIKVIKILVDEFKANVEKKDYAGMSPLQVAAVRGLMETVQFLIEKCGASVNATSLKGHSALMHAAYEGHFDLVKYLMNECNADRKLKSLQGFGLMHFASMGGHSEIVQYLLDLDPANFNLDDVVDEEKKKGKPKAKDPSKKKKGK